LIVKNFEMMGIDMLKEFKQFTNELPKEDQAWIGDPGHISKP
jgi:hypothetical protein